MISYLEHFSTFIEKNLPTYNDTFAVEDMTNWVQSREPQRRPQNIRDHLLKRTINYQSRYNFVPPPKSEDDLFFMIGPNLFRRYQPGVDPQVSRSRVGSSADRRIPISEFGRKRNVSSVPIVRKTSAMIAGDVLTRFKVAVVELDSALASRSLEDEIVSTSVRAWLDEGDKSLVWTQAQGLTDDEWFFITTLYGTMTADGQRTHIRKFFPNIWKWQRMVKGLLSNAS
jgi:hypothetical protein